MSGKVCVDINPPLLRLRWSACECMEGCTAPGELDWLAYTTGDTHTHTQRKHQHMQLLCCCSVFLCSHSVSVFLFGYFCVFLLRSTVVHDPCVACTCLNIGLCIVLQRLANYMLNQCNPQKYYCTIKTSNIKVC